MSIYKEMFIAVLFFTGILVSFMLGYGMEADFNDDSVVSLLIASGILFGSVFVVFYKEITE